MQRIKRLQKRIINKTPSAGASTFSVAEMAAPPLLFTLSVSLESGGQQLLAVRSGDDYVQLSEDFVRRHGLPRGAAVELQRVISDQLAAHPSASTSATAAAASAAAASRNHSRSTTPVRSAMPPPLPAPPPLLPSTAAAPSWRGGQPIRDGHPHHHQHQHQHHHQPRSRGDGGVSGAAPLTVASSAALQGDEPLSGWVDDGAASEGRMSFPVSSSWPVDRDDASARDSRHQLRHHGGSSLRGSIAADGRGDRDGEGRRDKDRDGRAQRYHGSSGSGSGGSSRRSTGTASRVVRKGDQHDKGRGERGVGGRFDGRDDRQHRGYPAGRGVKATRGDKERLTAQRGAQSRGGDREHRRYRGASDANDETDAYDDVDTHAFESVDLSVSGSRARL
jgi:hypothetical protein